MGMLGEFRKFALRGNVVDLAVGVIIGAAFGKVVTSLTNDVLMPPIGKMVGNVDFSNLFVALNGQTYSTLAEAQKAGAPTVNVGLFMNTVIDFIIVAFVVFLIVRTMNRLEARLETPAAAAAPTTKDCPECLSSIPLKARRCAHCTAAIA